MYGCLVGRRNVVCSPVGVHKYIYVERDLLGSTGSVIMEAEMSHHLLFRS